MSRMLKETTTKLKMENGRNEMEEEILRQKKIGGENLGACKRQGNCTAREALCDSRCFHKCIVSSL